jgi:methyl-accepting chemotaxis protein-1 (serine sensor receptor)
MKLSRKLPLCFAAVALVVACAGVFGMTELNRSIGTYRSAVSSYSQAQDVEALLSTFKTQIQEWKNTLLRGKDEAQRAKYWTAFQDSEAKVAQQAKALIAALPAGDQRELLAQFDRAHTQMGQDYRKGYAAFEAAGFDADAGDDAVKGKDRAPSELLVQVREQIVASTAQSVARADASSQRATTLSMLAMLLGSAAAIAAGFMLSRSIVRPLNHAVRVAATVAGGDLRTRIDIRSNDETGQLLGALKTMNSSLTQIVSKVRSGAGTLAVTSGEIAQGNMDLSSRTEQQAGSLEETASSMEELASTMKQNADNARQANQLAISACDLAQQGGQVVARAVTTMGSISESAKQIEDIIGVIDSIAFQTNILALNAAVEAARAGEQGRGFAVVASEVRNLAQRSATAAREIKLLINASVERVEAGSVLVNEAGASMADIVTSVKRVMDIIGEISNASAEQGAGIEQVNMAVIEMDSATRQNAALVEQAAASAQAMREQTVALNQVVSVFKLDGDTDAARAVNDEPAAREHAALRALPA